MQRIRYERILVATDFSDAANAALEVAINLSRHFECELVLVHAFNTEIPIAPALRRGIVRPDVYFEQIATEAEAHVDEATRKISASGVRAVGLAVDSPAAVAITGEAERRDADLIIMGTRGLSGLKHVALGSVADQVIRTSKCPVMAVP